MSIGMRIIFRKVYKSLMASLIVYNADVLTQNIHQPAAEAFAVDEEKLLPLAVMKKYSH